VPAGQHLGLLVLQVITLAGWPTTDLRARRDTDMDHRVELLGGTVLPFVESTAAIMALLTVSLGVLSGAISSHYALMHDLLQNEAHAGKASSLVALGGNGFGLLAPIVTGYIIAATGSYNWAFGTAGILLIMGAGLLIAFARKPIDKPRSSLREDYITIS
jgi:MFS family permease